MTASAAWRTCSYTSSIFVSSIGDGMHFIALSWFILELTGKVSAMGWLLVTGSLPGLLFPWIGTLVDRWNKKLVCVAMDWTRAVLVCLVPAAYYLDVLQPWMLYAVVFLVSLMEQFHLPSSVSLLQQSFQEDGLLKANSYASIGAQVGLLLGAALGGVIISSLEAPAVMLMNGASFLLSGLLMTLFPYVTATVSGVVSAVGTGAISGGSSSPATRVTSYIYAIRGLPQEFAEGLRYIAGMSKLHRFIGAQLFIFTVLYTCNTLLPVFTIRVLSLGAQALGFIDAAWAGGAILGGFLLTTFALFKAVQLLPVFILALCLGIGGFGVSGSLYQAASAYFLMGLLAAGTKIMTDTELQKATDPQYMGRVAGTIQSMTSYIGLIIYLSVSYLADTVDIRIIYCGLACLGGVGLLIAAGETRRASGTVPVQTPPRPPLQELSQIFNEDMVRSVEVRVRRPGHRTVRPE